MSQISTIMKTKDKLSTREKIFAIVAAIGLILFAVYYFKYKNADSKNVATEIKAETAKLNANKAAIDTNTVKANNANADLRKAGNEAVNKKNELITKLPNHAKTPVPNADYDAMFEHIIQPTTANR